MPCDGGASEAEDGSSDAIVAAHLSVDKADAVDEVGGERGKKPEKAATAAGSATAYHVARILNTLPHAAEAINEWLKQAPPKRVYYKSVVDDDDDDDDDFGLNLGSTNKDLKAIMSTPTNIRTSFIPRWVDKLCASSPKLDYVRNFIDDYIKRKDRSTGVVMMPSLEEKTVKYRTKFLIVSHNRFVRTVVSVFLRQIYGKEHVVDYPDSGAVAELLAWQRFYNPLDDKLADSVFIMVAAGGAVSQSLSLPEGHIIIALDPPLNNHLGNQLSRRQHRPGQLHDCQVIWLTSVVPKAVRNGVNGSLQPPTFDEAAVERNKAISHWVEDLRKMSLEDEDDDVRPEVVEIKSDDEMEDKPSGTRPLFHRSEEEVDEV